MGVGMMLFSMLLYTFHFIGLSSFKILRLCWVFIIPNRAELLVIYIVSCIYLLYVPFPSWDELSWIIWDCLSIVCFWKIPVLDYNQVCLMCIKSSDKNALSQQVVFCLLSASERTWQVKFNRQVRVIKVKFSLIFKVRVAVTSALVPCEQHQVPYKWTTRSDGERGRTRISWCCTDRHNSKGGFYLDCKNIKFLLYL